MRNYNEDNILDKNQKEILESFIKSFLPKRGNKRKNSGNEIDYVGRTINKIFIKYFGFNLSRQNILDAFEKLQYDIFVKRGVYDTEIKVYKPSAKGTYVRSGDGYSRYNAMYVYIDIDPTIVRALSLATFTPRPNTNADKILATQKMKREIYLFKQTIRHETNSSLL